MPSNMSFLNSPTKTIKNDDDATYEFQSLLSAATFSRHIVKPQGNSNWNLKKDLRTKSKMES